MKQPLIKYTEYKQHLSNGWILEKSYLMHSIAWSIYRYDFIIGSNTGTNLNGEPHPGYSERYYKFWSNCSTAEQEARAIADEIILEEINHELDKHCYPGT